MMMDPSDHPATSGEPSPHHSPDEDDDTVVTPTCGERAKPKERTNFQSVTSYFVHRI